MGEARCRVRSAERRLDVPLPDQCRGGLNLIGRKRIKVEAMENYATCSSVTPHRNFGPGTYCSLPRETIRRSTGAALYLQHVLSGREMPQEDMLHIVHSAQALRYRLGSG